MAFISNKERESFIKKINKSYGLRKALIIIEMVLLIGFIVMTFVCLVLYSNGTNWQLAWWEEGKFTKLGYAMLAWAIVEGVLGIICMILVLTLKSPKKVTQEVAHLEASPVSGKKVKRTQTATQVIKARTTVKDKNEKKAKK